jgi:hypothetical protein
MVRLVPGFTVLRQGMDHEMERAFFIEPGSEREHFSQPQQLPGGNWREVPSLTLNIKMIQLYEVVGRTFEDLAV